MAAPLPPNVIAKIATSFQSSHQLVMLELKGNILNTNNILRHAAVRMTDEPTAQQAMAIAKILKLPKA